MQGWEVILNNKYLFNEEHNINEILQESLFALNASDAQFFVDIYLVEPEISLTFWVYVGSPLLICRCWKSLGIWMPTWWVQCQKSMKPRNHLLLLLKFHNFIEIGSYVSSGRQFLKFFFRIDRIVVYKTQIH